MKNELIQFATDKVDKVGKKGDDDLPNDVINIINGVIGILGLVCVVVMIVGGVSYMTSSGDATKVKKAKDTILYGLIGLIICVLSFAIVNFVISNIIKDSPDNYSTSKECKEAGFKWKGSGDEAHCEEK